MRNLLAIVLFVISFSVVGQTYDQCVPGNAEDSLLVFQHYEDAEYYFGCQDYLKAASHLHDIEKILPYCSDTKESLALCYWEFYQDCSTYNVKHMLLAKKYLELCLQDRSIPKENKTLYQDNLNEINGILEKKLIRKRYADGTYYGEMFENKRQGYGIYYFNDKQRYEGFWIEDKKEDLEGEWYNSRNELTYKGVFSNDEKHDFRNSYFEDEIKFWESIKDLNDTTVFLRYLNRYGELGLYKDEAYIRLALLQKPKLQEERINDSTANQIANEVDEYLEDVKKKMKKENLERNFTDFTYSLSGYCSLRTGSMYPSKWGFYSGFGVKGDVINNGIYGINSMRYTMGALYAPSNWMYVYAGGGLSIDGFKANDSFNPTAELGLMFRLRSVSLSTGLQVDDFLHNPSFDLSFGFGFNINAFRMLYAPFTYYVYSPMAPYGIMCAWYRNNISGYFKIQIPMYGEKVQDLIAPDYKDNPVRSSFTAGLTTSLSSWIGFYTGVGIGIYKDKLDDNTKKQGLDAEIGASLRVSDILSVSAGLHGVNMTDKSRFLTYDVGIGISTWKAFLKRANHTIFEYSYSETANVGIMNGFIYNWYGYYNRIQLTNPFQENKQHNDSDKWNGSRYSMTMGPMIALTDWLYIHGGIGMGLYRKDNYEKSTDLGFETELGVSLRAWLFDVSFGPHWCRVGKDDTFLDYNLGVGVNILTWMGGGYEDDMFMEFRYSRHAQFGFNMGMLYDVGGWYFGMQGGMKIDSPTFRMNLFAGAVFVPSALMHFKLGAGVGLYGTQLGFDIEAMYSLILWRFPVTIGLKICRVGSPNMFIEPIYGVGTIGGL